MQPPLVTERKPSESINRFVARTLERAKEKRAWATASRLDNEAEEWPKQILDTINSQIPWLDPYQKEVELIHINSDRNTALGSVDIFPFEMTREAAAQSKQVARLPVILHEGILAPFDVMQRPDGAWSALREEDVQKMMSNPGIYSRPSYPVAKDPFSNPSGLSGAGLTPASVGLGPTVTNDGISKVASTGASRLRAFVLESGTLPDTRSMIEPLMQDAELRGLVEENPWLSEAVNALIRTGVQKSKTAAAGRSAEAVPEPKLQLPADVTQILFNETDGSCLIKTASTRAWGDPSVGHIRHIDDLNLPEEAKRRVMTDGFGTYAANPILDPWEPVRGGKVKAAHARDAGIYKIQTDAGYADAVVLPRVHPISRKMGARPGAIWIAPGDDAASEGWGMQEKVAGVLLRPIEGLPAPVEPHGRGIFYWTEGDILQATEPVNIEQRYILNGEDGREQRWKASILRTGERLDIGQAPGLLKLASVERGGSRAREITINYPEGVQWLPLPETERIALEDVDQIEATLQEAKVKIAARAAHADGGGVTVSRAPDGDHAEPRWRITQQSGDPIPGAGDGGSQGYQQSMHLVDASFTLCGMGLHERTVDDVLAKTADELVPVFIPLTRALHSGAKMKTAAARVLAERPRLDVTPLLPGRADIIPILQILSTPSPAAGYLEKVAAIAKRNPHAGAITGPAKTKLAASSQTLDAILSLGFITPENANTYVGFLPELTAASERLSELLVASRIGLDKVKEAAVRSALLQLGTVISGLERLGRSIA